MSKQRLNSIDPKNAQGPTATLLREVESAFGMVPNTTRVMANSPAVLEGFLNLNAALSKVSIGGKLHNQVKLAVSESNSCNYCTSILSAVAPSAGLSIEDVMAGREGQSADKKTDAVLKFAAAVLADAGKVSNEQIAAIREQGLNDTEIVEVVASVVMGCFTNFLNNVADTDLDIPSAAALNATN